MKIVLSLTWYSSTFQLKVISNLYTLPPKIYPKILEKFCQIIDTQYGMCGKTDVIKNIRTVNANNKATEDDTDLSSRS